MDSYLTDFMNGTDVNVLAYGQTGSGKTHTTFGPPGLMERAGRGEFGTDVIPEYGVFPRALMAIIDRVAAAGSNFLLTASAVELAYGMNLDMLCGKMPAFIDKVAKPNSLYGQSEAVLASRDDGTPIPSETRASLSVSIARTRVLKPTVGCGNSADAFRGSCDTQLAAHGTERLIVALALLRHPAAVCDRRRRRRAHVAASVCRHGGRGAAHRCAR